MRISIPSWSRWAWTAFGILFHEHLDLNAAAGGVAQEGQGGKGERIVADDEGADEDLLAGFEDHLGPRFRRLPLAFEEADLVVGSGEPGQEAEDEQEAEAAAGHGEEV